MNSNRHYRNQPGLVALSVALLLCFLSCEIHAASPVAKDFPSLKDACRLLDGPVLGDMAVAKIGSQTVAVHAKGAVAPFPAESPVLAFEENAHFLCAVTDRSNSLPAARNAENKKGSPTFVQRFIFLKPSIWVIEDSINAKACEGTLRWEVRRQGDLNVDDAELLCDVVWPGKELETSAAEADAAARCLRVFQIPPTDEDTAPAKAVLKNNDGCFDLTITSADRTYQLQLPLPEVGGGRIAVNDADGKTLVPLRPLPAGVLPHGPEGMKLIDRWDRNYRDGRHPPWNSGMAAPDLREAVEKGDIKPCRVAVLGCGSGTNAIYLAKQGFDVTAIDVAPTALSIAAADAEKAGVKVRWLLADVLALPELEPFDLIFDRGCYHNVRYVDAKGFVASLDRLSRPGTKFFVLSCDRDKAPGVREPTMRADFSELFDFLWLRKSNIVTGKDEQKRHPSWSVMLRKKDPKKDSPEATSRTKPNIIYVLVDDMGYGDPSCFGQKKLKTPNLDQMAATGLRLTNHYSGSTVCAPSRCVLMTGLHTGHCTVRTNGNEMLGKDDVTVAEVLKRAGYSTGCIGKWGIGRPGLSDPSDQGFDYFYGYVCMNHAHNCYPEFIIRNGEKVALRNVLQEKWRERTVYEGDGVAETKVDFVPHLCQKEVIQFIDKNKEKPFFLYYALNIPHANNEGGRNGMEVPSYGEFADTDWPDPEKGFAAMIRYIDEYVKEIFDKLKETGLDKNTLVIFTSDNGPHQEGGHVMEYFDSNGQLRGKKRDLYEGGVRVPTIAHWPGVIEPGTESDHVSAFQDMMPTFAEIAGVDCPKTDGISMAPTLLGKGEQREHEHLFWEFYEGGGKKAVLKGKWKGVRLNTFKEPDGPIELYDITADISEQKNVASEHPDIVANMARIMKEEHVDREK
ncbi:MAG: sulfatase-like hydrolase/transferase [Planctomycetes bacterium]|nr:sulfatase-like hydrolase/transferase [Planctomycetota bacterium]MBL7041400.1 sulfatase-like hydrolase/transferase [Pirellulaceae bacterium]